MISFEEFKSKWGGKKAAVIGIGISNIPLIGFLLSAGISVCARDKKSEDELGELSSELRAKGVKLIGGSAYLENIDEDIVFKTPGIRFDIPELLKARERGALVTSEMQLFFEMCPCHIIGITGSDGKTTTTTLISKMLERDGKRVYVGGNIGRPLLQFVREMQPDDYAVVELSSFQLQTMTLSPEIAVITNISENHLDYHKGYEEYINAKLNIIRQSPVRRAVLNLDNEYTKAASAAVNGGESVMFSYRGNADVYIKNGSIYKGNEKILDISKIRILGSYNVENYMAAIGALYDIVSKESIESVAQTFGGVEHRCEFVRTLDGAHYYNSSIDSTPSRSAACLSVFAQRVIAIMGGYDKNLDYMPYGDIFCEKIKTMILTGNTADKIEKAAKASELYKKGKTLIYRVPNLTEAVKLARSLAEKSDNVLLTPASASFDSFKNFEERGRFFKKAVNDLK